MNSEIDSHNNIGTRFKNKLDDLKLILPPLGKNIGHSCAAVTLTNILDALDIPSLKKIHFNN